MCVRFLAISNITIASIKLLATGNSSSCKFFQRNLYFSIRSKQKLLYLEVNKKYDILKRTL